MIDLYFGYILQSVEMRWENNDAWVPSSEIW